MDPLTAQMLGAGLAAAGSSASAGSASGNFSIGGLDGANWTVATNGGRASPTNIGGGGASSPAPLTGAVAGALAGTDWTMLTLAALGAIVLVRVLRRAK